MSINGSSDLSHQRQAPWMAPMHQYPAGAPAMVMPHHMMPAPPSHHQFVPPRFMPYSGFPHVPSSNSQIGSNGNNGENKTIWVGDLLQWMDETYLHSCFASTGEVVK